MTGLDPRPTNHRLINSALDPPSRETNIDTGSDTIMARNENSTTTTNHQLHQRLTPQWQQDLTQLPHSHAITQLLGERILPNIQPDGPTPTGHHSTVTTVTDSAHSLPPAADSSSVSLPDVQSLPPPRTDGPAAIRQLRELFKPQMRCNRTTPKTSPNDHAVTDLIERWIFQLNDHTNQSITTGSHDSIPNQMTSTTSLTISQSTQGVLCDLFHPLVMSTEPPNSRTTVPVTVTESKLNEPRMVDGDDGGDKESDIANGDKNNLQLGSQHVQPTLVSIPTYVTLMDLIVELYSTYGLCRRHENLCHQYLEAPTKLKVSKKVHSELFNLQELCSMPHRLWMSWSKNQRPLLEPFIQTHLIPDLANITLEYLLGNEFTVPFQIERQVQPIYRWRFPLREWRRDGENHGREFSPQFEMDGEKWRLLSFPGGNPNHMVPNCLAVYLELRDQLSYYNVPCQFKFRMVHPTDPHKSIWRDTTHSFTNYEVDRGFNDLLTPATIDEFTHPSDECVVLEVAAWKDPHQFIDFGFKDLICGGAAIDNII